MNKFKKIMAVFVVMLPAYFTAQISTYAMKNNEFNVNYNINNENNED